jgi:2-oxoglutarate dehydrogenase E1 component
MDPLSFLSNAEPGALEAMYARYRKDPDSVDRTWRLFFAGFDLSLAQYGEDSASPATLKEFKVLDLVHGYRTRGHLFTQTNPVRDRRTYAPTLALENFDLAESDLDTVFQAGSEVGIGPATLRDIVSHLESTYCHSIGIEYMYIREPERLKWVREHIELANRPRLDGDGRKHVLKKISQATLFEEFLQKKFVGQKRFSLEGGESLIPALDALIETGTTRGVREVVIGMAHRGRLSTLAHILGKPYANILCEFEGKAYDGEGLFDGDVKYHLGYSRKQVADTGEEVTITLAPNPSHLEAVDPVVEGIARARIDARDGDESSVLPILIHGDAAVAGQGVVYEVAQMAGLDGYRTGGTVHIVVNNQVGFTTNYLDARTSTYCTDVAKVTQALVFHVNADDVEAVVQVMNIALEYRQTFHRDVFIDLLGYRKYGHNEGDEPKFTQPKLYKAIAAHSSPRDIYLQKLLADGSVTAEEAEAMKSDLVSRMEQGFEEAKTMELSVVDDFLMELWEGYRPAKDEELTTSPKTGVAKKKLVDLATAMNTLPDGPKFFRKVKKLMNDRLGMIERDQFDWAMGEMLAYASLLVEGHPVRLSGQDVERGTFSHRHAVVKTEDSEEEVILLNELKKGQSQMAVYNSHLSEYAVSGFEYGYAFANPNGLTIWEAQFGDFNNGAQIMWDQFLSSGEDKWRTMNGLTLLLPHGYEGMGSEHSSGRMERFLQLGSGDNIIVANCTTPANMFHVLRRQVHRPFRKPLVVFTPKKLLRYPQAVSAMSDFTTGGFQEVMDDRKAPKTADTVVLCSGKVYYDLLEKFEGRTPKNMAVVRVEQLHPFPADSMAKVLKGYAPDAKLVWLQEEPRNMGGWTFMNEHMHLHGLGSLHYVGRSSSASPASGSPAVHQQRHDALLDEVVAMAKF